MRKILLILIPVVALLAACGGNDEPSTATSGPTNTPAALSTPTTESATATLAPTSEPTQATGTGVDPLTTPGMTKGDPNAPVHLVEYGDYQ